jgi:AraC family ethanolamine operon transcriptional activator
MEFSSLFPSKVLHVDKFDNPDVFCQKSVLPVRQYLLPQCFDLEFRRAWLKLDLVSLSVTRRPSLITNGIWEGSELGIALSMNDPFAFILNGRRVSAPGLILIGKESEYRIVEPEPWTVVTLVISNNIGDRSWPEAGRIAEYHEIPHPMIALIRSTVRDVIVAASYDPLRFSVPAVKCELQDSILSSLDAAFASVKHVRNDSASNYNQLRIARRVDEYIRLNDQKCLTCLDIACEIGQTVRTMHNAMVKANGVGLKKYILRHRLWSVRRSIMESDGDILIKTAALDHGFWHLGRFSRAYYTQFGEAPSDTLARARQQSNRPSQ